jgi:hypothetical protein
MRFPRLLNGHVHDPRLHHAERACSTERDVDDPTAHKRPAIIDAALNAMAAMGHRDHASHGACTMGAGHLAGMAVAAIVGGEARLRLRRGHRKQQER